MRRSIVGARPARALAQAFGRQNTCRAFATIPTKDTSPPSPIEPSQEQAHPIGAFYQRILDSGKSLPAKKPEAPPVTAKTSPSPPVAPAPEPASPTPAARAAPTPAPAAPVAPAPAKRGRKAKESPKDSDTKAKSVAPSTSTTSSATTSSSLPLPVSTSTSSEPAINDASAMSQALNDAEARARVVFGSTLAGPAERAERLAAIRNRSRLVAGVMVPPRPEEPDNCCMSGCVNCVWERYRDEVEEWAAAHGEAERRLRAQEAGSGVLASASALEESAQVSELKKGFHIGAASMDDDGGGSSGNWDFGTSGPTSPSGGLAKDFWDEKLYENVPVGIREFMKQEKRLKEKHLREGTAGG
ncbi:oxidoreductase-like protein [Lasiosphaeris hirsuta]|uniref:Oxidoreductase-like protein n=1 Tax=Lasiosphaeris hirsuta TaxID=260670 RepID=A0AA40A1T7_9PEZI|nr:oxidoreductase-like protein [Lasiosphaeris hirsuta]